MLLYRRSVKWDLSNSTVQYCVGGEMEEDPMQRSQRGTAAGPMRREFDGQCMLWVRIVPVAALA